MNKCVKKLVIVFCVLICSVTSAVAGSEKIVRDVVYNAAAGTAGVGDLYFPDGYTADTPVVLAIHGGGWSGLDRASWAGVSEFLCNDLGFVVFNIEYRLTGVAKWPACGNDCIAAANYLLSDAFQQKYGINCRKVWTCGGSAGGHLALWTGLSLPSEKVGGVISISGIGDLFPDEKDHPGRYVGLFGHKPTKAELTAASPLSLLKPKSPPIFCSHATVDGAVPFEAEKRFVDACSKIGVNVDFFVYEKRDSGHSVWLPGSKPHKLFPDIEAAITKFVKSYAE
jgi:acetyl esterase/lipase